MYLREWKCLCPKSNLDGFISYLRQTGVKDTQTIGGCLNYQILKRPFENQIEVTFMTYWESFKSMKEYTGDNLHKAVLYPEDEKYQITPDVEVKIYEVTERLKK